MEPKARKWSLPWITAHDYPIAHLAEERGASRTFVVGDAVVAKHRSAGVAK